MTDFGGLYLKRRDSASYTSGVHHCAPEMEPGRPGHGSPGQHFGSGRVTGQCPIHMTRSFDPDSALQNVLSVYWCAVTVSVLGSSGTGRLSTVSILAAI